MCTVIIEVPVSPADPTRMVAIRDEDPQRPWDEPGPWWPERYPGVVGIRDARAGGAWLAVDADAPRAAVVLNRLDLSGRSDDEVTTRGALALESVAGREPSTAPTTRGFNLVEVTPEGARVVIWDGVRRREQVLPPGVHMIAHDDADDPATARIVRWLGDFRAAQLDDSPQWWRPWLDVLARSADLPGDDPDAIIRDQWFEGARSSTLLAAAVEVRADDVTLAYAPLSRPGEWHALELS